MIVRIVLVTLLFLFVLFGIIAIQMNSFSDEDVERSFDYSIVSQIDRGNYSEEESDAILLAAEPFEGKDIVVSEIYEHERTKDHYVTIQDGSDTVVIIVRDGSNYAFSVNGGAIQRCYTNQNSKYCS